MPLKKENTTKLKSEIKKLQKEVLLLKKAAEQKSILLEKSQWESFFKYSKNTILVINSKLQILDINRVIKGLNKKKLIGKNALFFVMPESQKTMKQAIAKVFKTKKPQEYYCESAGKHNAITSYLSTATPIIVNKKVIAVVIEARDITTQLKAEQELTEAEQKFRMLTENAADIISRYSLYPERKLDYISPSVKTITGYSQEDFYKDPLLGFKIIHPDDLPILEKLNQEQGKQLKKGKLHSMVFRWVRKDKKVIWIEIINRPIFDKKNKLIAVEAVGRDITERKTLEQAKEFSDQTFSQLLNNINELVYYVKINDDGSRSISYLSDRIEKLIGISKEKYKKLGKNLINYCHPDDVPSLLIKAEKLKKDKKPQQFIFRFKNPKTKNIFGWKNALHLSLMPMVNISEILESPPM